MAHDIHELELDNGFRALLVPRRGLPAVATAMWYRVGARDERTGESGLAHFVEHMMFKGTLRYAKGEIDQLTSRMGGSNNAFTDHDSTVYHFSLPAERWETALDIEASRMRGCLLDAAEFTAEKSVVLEELAMGLDDPWTSLFQAVEAAAFDRHPYHRPIIGWQEELEGVGVDDMRAFYERHYGVDRGFLVVTGAIDLPRTRDRVAALFGDRPRAAPRPPVVAEPPQDGERRAQVHAPGTLTRIGFACHTCRIGERDDLVLDVIAHVLGGGKSSRLDVAMTIDADIASQVSVLNDTRLDPGLFWIYAEMLPRVEAPRGEAVIRDELKKLVARGITPAELQRARAQIDAALVFDEETVLGLAMKIGRFEGATASGWRGLEGLRAAYASITLEEVHAVATRYFAPNAWTAVWSLPEGQRQRFAFAAAQAPAARPAARKKPKAARRAPKKGSRSPGKKAPAKKPAAKKPAARKALRESVVRKAPRPKSVRARQRRPRK